MDHFKKITRQLTDFISASPSCYHVIDNIRRQLLAEGVNELEEQKPWSITPGSSYFCIRGGSSLIAFRIPSETPENYQLIASHSDSPSFKIKENPEICRDNSYVELNVEKYGGMLCAPWFDRPLSAAGRAVIEENGKILTRLVHFDRDLVLLPSLAIHMNRQSNENVSYKTQTDMLPLFGDGASAGRFNSLLAEVLGCREEQILGRDLFLYDRSRASFWGSDEQYFSAPRLDDLQCAFASVQAFLQSRNRTSINVCCIFDNEEVGSLTRQGADSTFLSDVLERISESLGLTREKHHTMIRSGFMLSADNAHAVHPNHIAKADPTNHVHLNEGVVIKHSANQKYTTDAVSAAIFRSICRKAGIPVQDFQNHSDVPGGSTLGNIANAHVSLNTIDIGAPQLAMHSPYETGGIRDTWYLTEAMKAFYCTSIHTTGNGTFVLEE
ncbi:MAG: M18 family aminopeptidase [Eubacteriales bacterium]|nr:M18 family aminopeptidase [Eubacteriales bacterium]